MSHGGGPDRRWWSVWRPGMNSPLATAMTMPDDHWERPIMDLSKADTGETAWCRGATTIRPSKRWARPSHTNRRQRYALRAETILLTHQLRKFNKFAATEAPRQKV